MSLIEERETVRADARQRAFRTLAQGLPAALIVTLVVAIGTATLPLVTSAQPEAVFTGDFWVMVGAVAAQAALTALLSYAARFQLPPAPTGPIMVPEPETPEPAGRHAAPAADEPAGGPEGPVV